MACYESSIEALKQLLHLGTQDRKSSDKSTDVIHCHITKASKDVTDAKNGIEYYFVEVTCSNGTQYGLQAYGRKLSSFTMKHTDIEYCGRKKGHVVILSFNTWHTEQSTISYPYWSFIPAAFFFMAIKVFSHFFLIFSLRWSDSLVGGKIAFTSSAISFSSRIM